MRSWGRERSWRKSRRCINQRFSTNLFHFAILKGLEAMSKVNSKIILILFFVISISGARCFSQSKQDTLNVLFVGNSYIYVNNLPHIVSLISDSTKTKIMTKKSTGPGASLREHWFGKKNLKTKEIIKNGQFDIVILQEQSMAPIFRPDSFNTYGNLFCDFIRENGATPYLFLTWAREKVPQYQDNLNKAYFELSDKNDAQIVPVGPAWRMALKIRPTIELFLPDGSHPSKLGTFLTACIFTKVLTGEIPKNLPSYFNTLDIKGETVRLMFLSSLDVSFCQKITSQLSLYKSGVFSE